MNYTRKRALLACDFCRHRKRRCDGQKPCSTCKDSNADCVYKELPYDRIEDASPTAVNDRLARIEALLEQQSRQLHLLSASSTPTNASVVAFDYTQSPLFPQVSEFTDMPSFPQKYINEPPTFLIPKGHTTLATTLLSVPQIQEHVGQYSRDFFYKIEESRTLPDTLKAYRNNGGTWSHLQRSILDKLSDSYFRNVHPHHPLFSPSAFQVWQSKLLKNNGDESAEAAICFCVYALGAIASPTASTPEASDEALGLDFFKTALAIVLHEYTWNFKRDIAVCQALLLAGSYFSHLGHPLHSWRMVYFASQRFLQNIETEDLSSQCNESELRVFWQCFLEDCNRAEDLDIVRSGIEPLGDKMPLPHSTDPSDHEETIHLFAEIAIRKLMNRVHSFLYNPDTEGAFPNVASPTNTWQGLSLQNLLTLSSELDRQLEQWYISMPDGIRPPRGIQAIPTDRGRVLRIRYYGARHIIHRPFVLYAAAQPQRRASAKHSPGSSSSAYGQGDVGLPQVVMDKCEICIDSCVTYLYNTIELLDKRSSYLWSFSQNCLACLLVLALAEGCPPLQRFVPSVGPLREAVVAKLERWAAEGSSFEAVVSILKALSFRETRKGMRC